MKLTDFLSDVGRPVAYYPELRKITGSTNATILLCQFIYWRGKESNNDGWLYKTSDEIEKETGLSYGEQKTARRDLISAGLLDEHYARLDHQMKFKLNLDAINEKWGKPQTEIPESGKPQLGNEGNQCSLNESEITTENTNGVPPNYGLDWKIANGEEITEKDLEQTDQERVDTANLIATGTGINSTAIYNLAYAFMTARQITIPFLAIKGNRKAAVEMLKMKVTPFHVVEATKKLLEAKMTVTDLFSIKKTAIDLANPAPEQSGYNPQGLDLS